MSIHYFNSIKVQLELMANRSNIMGLQFQFHKGTIRTRYPSAAI